MPETLFPGSMENDDATTIAVRVENWAGPRITHFTYEGRTKLSDGSEIRCGHWGHRTEAAAIKCGQKALRAAS